MRWGFGHGSSIHLMEEGDAVYTQPYRTRQNPQITGPTGFPNCPTKGVSCVLLIFPFWLC